MTSSTTSSTALDNAWPSSEPPEAGGDRPLESASADTQRPAPTAKPAPLDFEKIVRLHQSRVFAILHRYERNPHTLEDLAQETFLKAWRARDRFDGRVPFEHWLARIAVRVALDHLRWQKRRRIEVPWRNLGTEALEWLRDEDEEARVEGRHAAELLDVALNALSPLDRVVITLLELEGCSVKEASRITGSSPVAVRVRAFRARSKLRRALEKLKAGSP